MKRVSMSLPGDENRKCQTDPARMHTDYLICSIQFSNTNTNTTTSGSPSSTIFFGVINTSGIMALWIQTGDTYSHMVNDLISWLSECMQIVGYTLSFSEEHIATTYGTTQTSVYIEFGHTPGILKCDHIDYTIWHDHFSPKSIDTPWLVRDGHIHYNEFIMSAVASQITGVSIVLSSIFSGADQRKHQSSASLAFVRGNPLVTDGFPSRSVDNAENVSIWWRHHDSLSCEYSLTPAPPPFQCQCNFIVWIH